MEQEMDTVAVVIAGKTEIIDYLKIAVFTLAGLIAFAIPAMAIYIVRQQKLSRMDSREFTKVISDSNANQAKLAENIGKQAEATNRMDITLRDVLNELINRR